MKPICYIFFYRITTCVHREDKSPNKLRPAAHTYKTFWYITHIKSLQMNMTFMMDLVKRKELFSLIHIHLSTCVCLEQNAAVIKYASRQSTRRKRENDPYYSHICMLRGRTWASGHSEPATSIQIRPPSFVEHWNCSSSCLNTVA